MTDKAIVVVGIGPGTFGIPADPKRHDKKNSFFVLTPIAAYDAEQERRAKQEEARGRWVGALLRFRWSLDLFEEYYQIDGPDEMHEELICAEDAYLKTLEDFT